MRTPTLALPADDLFGRAIAIAQTKLAGSTPAVYATRSAVAAAPVGAKRRSWLERLDAWFARQEQRERDAYLAQSQDLFELERRIRHLDQYGVR